MQDAKKNKISVQWPRLLSATEKYLPGKEMPFGEGGHDSTANALMLCLCIQPRAKVCQQEGQEVD